MNNYTLLTNAMQKLPSILPLALPSAGIGSGKLMQAWLSSRLTLPLLLDYAYAILGEKTNLRLSEGRDACIDG